MSTRLLLLDEVARRNAQRSLRYFTARTYPIYEFDPFHVLLCRVLDRFVENVAAGRMPRLMIFAPPRSGKSELASRRLPPYVLGRFPNWNVISTSYSRDLANRMSRDCQRIMGEGSYTNTFDTSTDPGALNFPTPMTTQTDLWEVVAQGQVAGSYRCAGVGGGITGQGMNIGIIDDPVKDYRDASSAVYQERLLDWYHSTFWTRCDPKINGIILIMTRWHQRDLAGTLLAEMEEGGEQWEVVRFPMVAEQDEYFEGRLFRQEGDLLCPNRMPQDFVDRCRNRGPMVWNGLYQQRPTAKGGTLFHLSWLRYHNGTTKNATAVILEDGTTVPLRCKVAYGDTASKTGEQHDYSVFQLWGQGQDGKIYLLDMIRGKWEAPELKKMASAFFEKHRFSHLVNDMGIRCIKIEDKASGTGLIQELRGNVPVEPIPRNKDKVSRAMSAAIPMSEGRVVLPAEAPFLSDLLFEIEDFNAELTHANDDQIDPMMDAIEDLVFDGGSIYSALAL